MKIVLLEDLAVDKHIIDEHALKLKDMGHELVTYDKNTDPEVQKERLKDADICILANMPLSDLAIKDNETLKYIDVAFTGVDHIPVKLAKEKGIKISNASGYATEAVAELCIGFMIDLLRNVKETEEKCRNGGTKAGLVGSLLKGKVVGIVGAGAIGKKVAEYVKVFGAHPIAYSRSKVTSEYIEEQVSLEELMQVSDIVTLHCPLTDETRNLINKDMLSLMKKSAILINTARGPVVDSNALSEALNNEDIKGAALDVFETEPPLDINHPLLHARNTIVTPHIAFASKESMEMRVDIVFDNLYAYLSGEHKNAI